MRIWIITFFDNGRDVHLLAVFLNIIYIQGVVLMSAHTALFLQKYLYKAPEYQNDSLFFLALIPIQTF